MKEEESKVELEALRDLAYSTSVAFFSFISLFSSRLGVGVEGASVGVGRIRKGVREGKVELESQNR